MANGKKTAAATKKRGRPPGTKRAGSARGKSASKRPGRPEKPKAAAAGHVLISKKTLKDFHKRIANLEAALGSFANALRVLE